MSDGFTTRLRQYGMADCNAAADEIDRLRKERDLLTKHFGERESDIAIISDGDRIVEVVEKTF